jgi:hypothetical protein
MAAMVAVSTWAAIISSGYVARRSSRAAKAILDSEIADAASTFAPIFVPHSRSAGN